MKWLAILLVAACAHTKTPEVYVHLERGMGLWNLAPEYNYQLTLYSDGSVKFEGIVDGRPARLWGKIDPKRVAALMQEAEAVPEWHCEDRITTDQPYADIIVSRNGITRHFDVDAGDPCVPQSGRDVSFDIEAAAPQFTAGR